MLRKKFRAFQVETLMNKLFYHMYELGQASLAPARAFSDFTKLALKNPINPLSHTPMGKKIAASAELFERMTRRYTKPAFGLATTNVAGVRVAVEEKIVWEKPFCSLVHFERQVKLSKPQPKLLIVAPMSGHFATLLRGTVEAFLPTHEVYITDWVDARMVAPSDGAFDLDDYIDYLIAMCRMLNSDNAGVGLHTLGVCQPSVPLLAAVARMEAENDACVPASMTLMGGPIDTRKSPTAVNRLAQERGTKWFEQNCVQTVPFPYPGTGRHVYPGYLQLSGFMAMNYDRHVSAHRDMFEHLVRGDGDLAEKHREFYDEYLAVMDLTAEYYLQTVETVFVKHSLPEGTMLHRGKPVDLTAISRCGLMTVEGENDDISGVGQTYAAQELCTAIPPDRKQHYLQKGVGHYGVFNGSRFRAEIAPRIGDFIANIEFLNRQSQQPERPAPAGLLQAVS